MEGTWISVFIALQWCLSHAKTHCRSSKQARSPVDMTLGKQPKVRTAGKPPPGSSASSTIRLLSWLQARKLPASSNLHWAWSQGEHHAVGSQWLCQDALWGHSKLQDNP